MDVLIEKDEPLTEEEKKLFGSFGVGARIRPPFRILDPHRIFIGDYVSLREECYLHAHEDLTKLHAFIEDRYKDDFDLSQYKYDSRIVIGRDVQAGRNLFISCTRSVEIGRNVTISSLGACGATTERRSLGPPVGLQITAYPVSNRRHD